MNNNNNNNRYSFQELKNSGFTYYEIIDTLNNCEVVYRSKKYIDTISKLNELVKTTNKFFELNNIK